MMPLTTYGWIRRIERTMTDKDSTEEHRQVLRGFLAGLYFMQDEGDELPDAIMVEQMKEVLRIK